ncbi:MULTISPECIES: type II secretion system protein [Gracilibacillus]|uniref:type II secretion system protein n=1 Tax=Gracilibacillus TaxID=74385 RepID=UPI0008267F9A|nr:MULTISPECIES: type II secretion system protein [Gracilibacillus]
MRKNKQQGFYLLEALLSVTIFFNGCLTLLPIQYHILLEKQIIQEENAALYFLSNQIQEALLNKQYDQTAVYEDVLDRPLTLQISHSANLLKGCVTWTNEKETESSKCLYTLYQE